MKFFKNHFGLIINVVLALLMGLFMGIAILIINHAPINWVSLIDMWGDITLVVFFMLLAAKIGEIVAVKSIGVPGQGDQE